MGNLFWNLETFLPTPRGYRRKITASSEVLKYPQIAFLGIVDKDGEPEVSAADEYRTEPKFRKFFMAIK